MLRTYFVTSLKPSWNIINAFLDNGRKRLTRGMLQKLNEQNVTGLNRESLLPNSVILNNAEQTIVIDEETNREDQDVSVIKYSPKPSLPLQQISQKEKLRSSLNKKKNRSSIILINNDLSNDYSADVHESSIHESIQSLSNGENIGTFILFASVKILIRELI